MAAAALSPARSSTPDDYDAELRAASADARALVDGLGTADGVRRPAPDQWSVADCLAHLAATTRVYLPVLDAAIAKGRAAGRTSAAPFRPGLVSRWIVRGMDAPPRRTFRAPRAIVPPAGVTLAAALADFEATQAELRARVAASRGLDLGAIRLRSPLAPLLSLRLGTAFGLLAAHQRRHLWQGWRVREALS
jgi:hypothetical protein